MHLIEFLTITEEKAKVRVKKFPYEVYKGYVGRKLAGFAQIYTGKEEKIQPNERHIWKSAVDPSFQRQGVATAIYDAIAKDLAAQGLTLVPSPGNVLSDDAYKFWMNRNPEAMKNDPRNLAKPFLKYVGRQITVRGRPAVIIKALNDKVFKYRFTDVPEGSTSSQGSRRWEVMTESVNIPPTTYGYWITGEGQFLPVSNQGHDRFLLDHGHRYGLNVPKVDWQDENPDSPVWDIDYDAYKDKVLSEAKRQGWISVTSPPNLSSGLGIEIFTPTRHSLMAAMALVKAYPETQYFTDKDTFTKKIDIMRYLNRALENTGSTK